MHVTGLGWVGIMTENFESTLRFYTEMLGLSLVFHDETREIAHFRFRSGQLLEVFGPRNRGRKEKYRWFKGSALGFEVDDVSLARQEMIARGVRFVTELESWEEDMWTMFLGPEENLFEILRPSRSPAGNQGNILGIGWASISVQDFTKAMQFFSQVMEMPITEADHGERAAHCRLSSGHLFEVMNSRNEKSKLIQHSTFGFEVENIVEARREMESKGIEFVGPTETMENGFTWRHFRAPDGLTCALVSGSKHFVSG